MTDPPYGHNNNGDLIQRWGDGMSDRLAEIEATRKKILSEYEFSRADDDMLMLLTSEIPWLLARAHELDTQAELMVDVYKGADLPELVARVNAAEARVRELEELTDGRDSAG